MHVVILGGTRFVGRYAVEALLNAGHELTLFNRGVTDPSAFPDVEHIRGDRHADLARLKDIRADVVIDSTGYAPDSVRDAALAFSARVQCYVFVSSMDVYDFAEARLDESSQARTLDPSAPTNVAVSELYGPQKAACERELVQALGAERVLIVRPGLVVGPHDYTDRFTYWPVRVERGGTILAPGEPAMPVQIIDARDLGTFIAQAVAREIRGTYNLVGTPGSITMGEVLDTCSAEAGGAAQYEWVSEQFLTDHEVGSWYELPLWVPEGPSLAGLRSISNERAIAAGLTLRPLRETIRDVLDEYHHRSSPELKAGLAPEKEAMLLTAWHKEQPRREHY